MMAETSAELADLTVLTAEDPRTESLEEILEEMAEARGPREDARAKRFGASQIGEKQSVLR